MSEKPRYCIVFSQYHTEHIVTAMQVLGSRSILDLGCGSGGTCIDLALHGMDVVGVDKHPETLAIAEYKYSHLHLPRKEFVEGVWRIAEQYKDSSLFCCEYFNDEAFYPAVGDFEEHDCFVKDLPLEAGLDGLRFVQADLNTADFRRFAPSNLDSIIFLEVLAYVDTTRVLEKALNLLPVGGNILMTYCGDYHADKKVWVKEDDLSLHLYAPEEACIRCRFEDVLEVYGFAAREDLRALIEPKIQERFFSLVYGFDSFNYHPIDFMAYIYAGTKERQVDHPLTRAVKLALEKDW